MPEIGEIRRGIEIFKQPFKSLFVYWPCPKCGNPRWIINTKRRKTQVCTPCHYKILQEKFSIKTSTNLGEPVIGEMRRGEQLGFKAKNAIYVWHACIDCGKARWVKKCDIAKGVSLRCGKCKNKREGLTAFGEGNHNWKGGKMKLRGYILVYITPDDFYFPMSKGYGHGNSHYVQEHRLVMARHLGRLLHSWEIVHHKNGIRDDNRIENLELTTLDAHTLQHNKGYKDGYTQGLYDGKDEQVKQLKLKIIKLENQLSQLGVAPCV